MRFWPSEVATGQTAGEC